MKDILRMLFSQTFDTRNMSLERSSVRCRDAYKGSFHSSPKDIIRDFTGQRIKALFWLLGKLKWGTHKGLVNKKCLLSMKCYVQ